MILYTGAKIVIHLFLTVHTYGRQSKKRRKCVTSVVGFACLTVDYAGIKSVPVEANGVVKFCVELPDQGKASRTRKKERNLKQKISICPTLWRLMRSNSR